MDKILLVNTGGTIGSSEQHRVLKTSATAGEHLLSLFGQRYAQAGAVAFETMQPFNLLSENLIPENWEILIRSLETVRFADFDGVIITHGTDTLAYTAAVLSYYYNGIQIPMLLVSSNHPLTHPQANGLDNFISAVEYIRQRQPRGVFVAYKNPDGPALIHRGTRLASSLQLSGDFISVQSKAFMHYTEGRFNALQQSFDGSADAVALKPVFGRNIQLIRPYPGLNYDMLDLEHVDVVLHDLYHSGTACVFPTVGADRYSLQAFARNCRRLGVKLYVAPILQCETFYETTQCLLDEQVHILWNMSLEAAYCKLLIAYGNFTEPAQIERFLATDIAYEHI